MSGQAKSEKQVLMLYKLLVEHIELPRILVVQVEKSGTDKLRQHASRGRGD
jgi:hypothetical protein